jgi:RecA/RadA recombinase
MIKDKIIIKGVDRSNSIRNWKINGSKIVITFNDGKRYSYNRNNVQIKQSALSSATAQKCLNYLKTIAKTIGLKDLNGNNILSGHYEKIGFVGIDSMLSAFLLGKLQPSIQMNSYSTIFPFGFNTSQKIAVDNALNNKLSIIEGPPGTGKTQTILNILANAVMHGESVAVVSSNNSATANVLEKLKKYNVDFIAAYLGNYDNKQQFIESQKPLPDLSGWKLLPKQREKIKQSIQYLYISLNEMLLKKNELSKIKKELDALELEYKHFCKSYYSKEPIVLYLKPTSSSAALELWFLCEEKYIGRSKKPWFFEKIINRFKRGVINKTFYSLTPDVMIDICQKQWYMAKIKELTRSASQLQAILDRFNFSVEMKEYSDLSMKLFRDELTKKYQNTEREKFEMTDLRSNSKNFIKEYPVILATTYSIRSSLAHDYMYDYVIIDEASQVDLATGALALSCAKKAVIVGDLKQLPNVVDLATAQCTDKIFSEFKLPEMYRYKNHSLLLSISKMFSTIPKTLLREHYRCHPKIIEFCNQKFYDGQLIILTESQSKRSPLIVYKTVPGNHARGHINQRQIDTIKQEIIPQQQLNDKNISVGIVTPYRDQTNALQSAFAGAGIQADTVDKFQGRENDVIILSTVDNTISDFADNDNRLNVAISRAREQLIVVMSDSDTQDTNIGDLVRYIEYNNLEVIQSEVYSIFDCLYKNYQNKRNELLSKRIRISQYASENSMYDLIKKVLATNKFIKLDVVTHIPLKSIIRISEKLTDDETTYAKNIRTHVDFLIFDKFGKMPRLIVEVDGASYHAEGTRQAERDKLKNKILEKYGLPIMRFKTTGSGEYELLTSKLNEIIN